MPISFGPSLYLLLNKSFLLKKRKTPGGNLNVISVFQSNFHTMSLTTLCVALIRSYVLKIFSQAALSDIFERVILRHEVFDPDQETYNFLVAMDQTPESETNQRYLQLFRTLRHEDYNVRSSAAKFLCIILCENHYLQTRFRSLLPLTILTANLLVFNSPAIYNASMLAELQKVLRNKTEQDSYERYYILPSTACSHAHRRDTGRFKGVKRLGIDSKDTSQRDEGSPVSSSPKQLSHQSRSLSPVSNRSLEKKSCREDQSFTINTERYIDSPSPKLTESGSLTKRTPKFREKRDFWMPGEFAGPAFSRNNKGRIQRKPTKKSASTKSMTHNETRATTPNLSVLNEGLPLAKDKKSVVPLLDLLERNTDDFTRLRGRSNSRINAIRLQTDHSESISPINPGFSIRPRSCTNPKKSVDARVSVREGTETSRSDMMRETFRLLKQDRHDIYKDYDKQVERLGLRPFDKNKFHKGSFNPAWFPRKIETYKVDRKKAFLEFLNSGGKHEEKPPEKESRGIKGNAFNGRKWRDHVSKARLSNFGRKENYIIEMSPITAGAYTEKMRRTVPKEKGEIETIKEHLQMDVASSQQKYISNIMEVNKLDENIYGENFKKYLDVLNYEKANYNAPDASKMQEAFDLVSIIYEAKEKPPNKGRGQGKPKDKYEHYEQYDEKCREYIPPPLNKKLSAVVPRSRLFIRKGSTSSCAPEELNEMQLAQGKRGSINREKNMNSLKCELVKTVTNNSAGSNTGGPGERKYRRSMVKNS